VRKMKWVIVFIACLSSASFLAGQQVVEAKGAAPLDAEREERALQSLSTIVEKEIISAVDAMPADKFGFAPTDGEFKGVRTFGQMVKHLSEPITSWRPQPWERSHRQMLATNSGLKM
jgi:hypothetical protein